MCVEENKFSVFSCEDVQESWEGIGQKKAGRKLHANCVWSTLDGFWWELVFLNIKDIEGKNLDKNVEKVPRDGWICLLANLVLMMPSVEKMPKIGTGWEEKAKRDLLTKVVNWWWFLFGFNYVKFGDLYILPSLLGLLRLVDRRFRPKRLHAQMAAPVRLGRLFQRWLQTIQMESTVAVVTGKKQKKLLMGNNQMTNQNRSWSSFSEVPQIAQLLHSMHCQPYLIRSFKTGFKWHTFWWRRAYFWWISSRSDARNDHNLRRMIKIKFKRSYHDKRRVLQAFPLDFLRDRPNKSRSTGTLGFLTRLLQCIHIWISGENMG